MLFGIALLRYPGENGSSGELVLGCLCDTKAGTHAGTLVLITDEGAYSYPRRWTDGRTDTTDCPSFLLLLAILIFGGERESLRQIAAGQGVLGGKAEDGCTRYTPGGMRS